jgi:hypothetical protein
MSMALFLSDGAEGVPRGAVGRRGDADGSAESSADGAGRPLLQAVTATASVAAAGANVAAVARRSGARGMGGLCSSGSSSALCGR